MVPALKFLCGKDRLSTFMKFILHFCPALTESDWFIYSLLTGILAPYLFNLVFWAWLSTATLRFFSLADQCHTHELFIWLNKENISAHSGPCHQQWAMQNLDFFSLAEHCHTHNLLVWLKNKKISKTLQTSKMKTTSKIEMTSKRKTTRKMNMNSKVKTTSKKDDYKNEDGY